MNEKMQQLRQRLAEIADLNNTASLISWDQQVNMPPLAAEDRGHQLALVRKLMHERQTDPALGRLLGELKSYAAGLDPDSDDARLVRVSQKDFDRLTCVPAEYMAEQAQVTSVAQGAWVEARQKSDFALFQPHLEKVLELNQRYVGFFPKPAHPYDPLLDIYEPGMKTAEVQAIFDGLRPHQVALIKAIAAKPQVEDAFLHQPFDEQKQWDFGVQVITRFGYDWQRGRQDKSAHPFTQGFGVNDVRITTRVNPEFFNPMIFGTMHEAGHALYELGTDPAINRTMLENGASFAVHESQSRMWENLVGRSLAFWEHFYPRLQETFPQLAKVPLEKFYRGINKVQPSPIRVEADEATYNLHIMLRMEIEIALVEGTLAVADLPAAWNQKMQDYLGVTPADDARGVLQDVHWSLGYMGYFPTYALGNLVSAQLWEKINQDLPDLADQVRDGKFDGLLGWLRSHIHRHGRKFEPQELVEKVTGSRIDPAAYIRYLKGKYGQIYGL